MKKKKKEKTSSATQSKFSLTKSPFSSFGFFGLIFHSLLNFGIFVFPFLVLTLFLFVFPFVIFVLS